MIDFARMRAFGAGGDGGQGVRESFIEKVTFDFKFKG